MATSRTATSRTWISTDGRVPDVNAMQDAPKPLSPEQIAARRKGVLRTAWAIGLVALAVYLAFLLSGVLGK